MDQWQLEELAKVRRKARVKIVSDGLPAATIDRLFVESAPSVEQAVAESLGRIRPRRHNGRNPQGPLRAGASRRGRQRFLTPLSFFIAFASAPTGGSAEGPNMSPGFRDRDLIVRGEFRCRCRGETIDRFPYQGCAALHPWTAYQMYSSRSAVTNGGVTTGHHDGA